MSEKNQGREGRVNAATQPLLIGALGVTGGIAASLLGAENVGAASCLAGLGLLAWGLHRLGRLGPDPPSAG